MADAEGDAVAQGGAALSAGAMLRAARERQGMHIAVLAASIKVSPRKLDALEHDRYAELPDATFVRALAQTVCRALKIDAQPILARLPQAGSAGLEQVSGGLNAPFRERPGRSEPGTPLQQRPLVWAGIALLAAAAAIVLVPPSAWDWFDTGDSVVPASAVVPAPIAAPGLASPASASAASAPEGAASAAANTPAAGATVETVYSVPADAPAAAAALKGASITTSEPSWVEAVDGASQVLLSRVVLPGETVGIDGRLPLSLKIGNARATQLVFRGRPVDLADVTRDNVARLELK